MMRVGQIRSSRPCPGKAWVRLALLAVSFLPAARAAAAWTDNPGFESAYSNGWVQFSPMVAANSPAEARSRSSSLKFETPPFVTGDPNQVPGYTVVDSPHNPAEPGRVYVATMYYFANLPLLDHERFGMGIFWLKLVSGLFSFSSIDPGGWTIVFGPESTQGFPNGEETVGAWTQIAFPRTAPADAEFMQVAIEVRGTGSTVYFDDVFVFPDLNSPDQPARMTAMVTGGTGMALTWANPLGDRAYNVERDVGAGWNLLEELNFADYEPTLGYEDLSPLPPHALYRVLLR
jgi:hypothetical protein